jgi:hypothetical protein
VLVGLTLKVDLHALGKQTTTPLLTAAGQNGAAILGFHARTESELLFACAFRGLVRAFHNSS